jgi:A/G-specific adenine glycosylase
MAHHIQFFTKPSDLAAKLFGIEVVRWWQDNGRIFPWRRIRANAYHILVAEFLLRRTTVAAAERVYPTFLAVFPDLLTCSLAETKTLEDILTPIGLHRQRASAIKAATTFIAGTFASIPSSLEELLTIPGVGPYSSRAILSFAYGQQFGVVDSNVLRVVSRYAGESHVTVSLVQNFIDAVVPLHGHEVFNWGMLDIGAKVCRYGSPQCELCPLLPGCHTARLRSADMGNPIYNN